MDGPRACALKLRANQLPKQAKVSATLFMEIPESAKSVLALGGVKTWDLLHVARTHVTKYVKEVSISQTS